jgi:molybdopterin/thiamine biosynthesis adenylyltransferase
MPNWWDDYPERWEHEKRELERLGMTFEIDVGKLAAGKAVIRLEYHLDGQAIQMTATFPSIYPYFPPLVVAPNLNLARHQTPGTKQLCLLERGGQGWKPGSDTLAGLIYEQLPLVFASQTVEDNAEVAEIRAGEPITGFISTEVSSFIGFPAYEFSELTERGTFQMGLESALPLRATVLELYDSEKSSVATSEVRDEAFYNENKLPIVTGRWVRLVERPRVTDAKGYYDIAKEALDALQHPHWQTIKLSGYPGKSRIDLIALLFEDEMAWRGEAGNAILISKLQLPTKNDKHSKITSKVHRTELESRTNYFVRDPQAEGLQKGTVSLVGVGSIGSPAAKLLAQAGIGDLRIIDQDILDAGNAIRWEIGRTGAGQSKAHCLQKHLTANFPFTKVTSIFGRLGDATDADQHVEKQVNDSIFKNVTCIFDASASIMLNQYLSETARKKGIPYIWMHSTNGARGGLIGRISPTQPDFCWMCHMYYLADGQVEALSAAADDIVVQAPGCH